MDANTVMCHPGLLCKYTSSVLFQSIKFLHEFLYIGMKMMISKNSEKG